VLIIGSSGMRWQSDSRRAAGMQLASRCQPLITGIAGEREEHVAELGNAGVSGVSDDALSVIGDQPGDHVALAGPHGGVAGEVGLCSPPPRQLPAGLMPCPQAGAGRGQELGSR
jgi:hypothetical protein